jgi:hypothetical protein
MSSPDPTTTNPATTPATAPASPDRPRYPQVRVRLSGTDGNAHILIGKVAVALRRQVGDDAADTFNTAAYGCGSHDELLRLIQSTVRVS